MKIGFSCQKEILFLFNHFLLLNVINTNLAMDILVEE